MSGTYTILKIAPASYNDIAERIRALGPQYSNMFLVSKRYGGLILLDRSEVALAADDQITKQFERGKPPRDLE